MLKSLVSVSTVIVAVLTIFPSIATAEPAAMVYYVAVDGNDAWSGKLPTANAEKTDGPLASIAAARDAIRKLKAEQGTLRQPVNVQVRAGTYYITETIALVPEGNRSHPGQQ